MLAMTKETPLLLGVEELEGSKRRLRIALAEEDVEKKMAELYAGLQRNVEIRGFRKGKAPRAVIENRYRDEVRRDAIRSLSSEALYEVVEETGLKPIAVADEDDFDIETTPRDGKYHVSATVEVRPNVELGDYRGLEFTEKVLGVTDADVDKALDELREQHAELSPVSRPSAVGDYVFVDYERLDTGGNVVPESAVSDYPCEVGAGLVPPELDQALAGVSIGDEKTVAVTYPKDYNVESLAGRTVSFRVKVKDVKQKLLPALTDDFARTVGRFETLLDLRVKVRNALEAQAKAAARRRLEEEIVTELTKRHSFELPASMIESRLTRIRERLSERNGGDGRDLDEDEIRKAFGPIVEAQLRGALILEAVAEKEGVEITQSDIDARVAEIGERHGKDPVKLAEDLKGTDALSRIQDDLWLEKVHDFLVRVSKVETELVEAQEEGAGKPEERPS